MDDRHYGMFSDAGERAVDRAVRREVASLLDYRDSGYTATENKLSERVSEITREVYALGHREVGDTAVREAIYYALDVANGTHVTYVEGGT